MMQADDYPVVIRRSKSGYVAEAVGLGLKRSGPDVSVLEADIRAAVQEILTVCERHDAKIQMPQDNDAVIRGASSYRRGIVGAMAVLLLVIIISMPLMWGFQRLTNIMSSFDQFSTARIEKLLSSGVQKAANTLETITPQRRDQLANDFGRIARALEPYAAQLRPLLVSSEVSNSPNSPGERRP